MNDYYQLENQVSLLGKFVFVKIWVLDRKFYLFKLSFKIVSSRVKVLIQNAINTEYFSYYWHLYSLKGIGYSLKRTENKDKSFLSHSTESNKRDNILRQLILNKSALSHWRSSTLKVHLCSSNEVVFVISLRYFEKHHLYDIPF